MDNIHPSSFSGFNAKEEERGFVAPGALKVARDVNIASDGEVSARMGSSRVARVSNGSQLLARGGALFVLKGDELHQVALGASPALTALIEGLDPAAQLLLHEWPKGSGQVLLACGTVHRVVTDGVVRAWGLPVPSGLTSAVIAGELDPATYLVAVTFRDGPETDPTAQESGATAPVEVTLTSPGGMRLIIPAPDTNATYASFYLSGPNQPELFRAVTVPVVTPTVTPTSGPRAAGIDVVTKAGVCRSETPLLTQSWGPPLPNASAVGSVQGFVLYSVGNALYRSWPGRPGLFQYGRAFQLFPSAITAIAGLQEGAFVATRSGLYWLSGDNPTAWVRRRVSDAIVIPEAFVMDGKNFPALDVEGEIALFVTAQGLVAGLPNGTVRALTENRYAFPGVSRVSMGWCGGAIKQLFISAV